MSGTQTSNHVGRRTSSRHGDALVDALIFDNLAFVPNMTKQMIRCIWEEKGLAVCSRRVIYSLKMLWSGFARRPRERVVKE